LPLLVIIYLIEIEQEQHHLPTSLSASCFGQNVDSATPLLIISSPESGQPFGTFGSPASPKKATPLALQPQYKATRYSSAIMPKRMVFGNKDKPTTLQNRREKRKGPGRPRKREPWQYKKKRLEERCAGKGSRRREELAEIAGGSSTQPFLIDPNTKVKMAESRDIIEYLYERYARWTPPSAVLGGVSAIVTPLLAPIYRALAPLQAGSSRDDRAGYDAEISSAKAEIYEEISRRTVVVYTYDLSPFCADATSLLRSAGIKFSGLSETLDQ